MTTEARNEKARIGVRQVARALLSLFILAGSPFLAADRLDWWRARALIPGIW